MGWILAAGGAAGLVPVVTSGQQPVPAAPSPVPAEISQAADRNLSHPLEIRTFRIGRRHPGDAARWIDTTFVTDEAETLTVTAEVVTPAVPGGELSWEVVPPEGFVAPDLSRSHGTRLHCTLLRPGGNPTGAGAPLTLSVAACWRTDSGEDRVSREAAQDAVDRLRQEYVDLQRSEVPARDRFLTADDFARRYAAAYPNLRFEDFNHSRRPDAPEERYPVILADPRLLATVAGTFRRFERRLTVTSGFRNPVRQEQVHAPVNESHHQYGRAADLYVEPGLADPNPKDDPDAPAVAAPADWFRLAAVTLRSGGSWVEPMTQCHVNTDGCHVHVDVREIGPLSRVCRIAGRITDAAGRPFPGARVAFCGHEAFSNAGGRFSIKHALVPGEAELTATAAGSRTSRTITIPNQPGPIGAVVEADLELDTLLPADSIRTAGSDVTAGPRPTLAPEEPGSEPAAAAAGLLLGAAAGAVRFRLQARAAQFRP